MWRRTGARRTRRYGIAPFPPFGLRQSAAPLPPNARNSGAALRAAQKHLDSSTKKNYRVTQRRAFAHATHQTARPRQRRCCIAIIKLGGLAQDVRGSLNGTVFSRNKGGAYTRSKVSPVQPISDANTNSKQAFKEVSQMWSQLLTDEERASWIAFAALHPFVNVFGDSIVLSGIAFFQAANKRLVQIGFPAVAEAPADWDVIPPGAIAPVLSSDGAGNVSLLINPTTAPDVATDIAYLFATQKIGNGAQPQRNQYRLINTFDGDSPDDTFDWGPLFKARFDDYVPQNGDKIGILYAYFDSLNGAISVASGTTVVATDIPGPLIPIGAKQLADAGDGDVYPQLTTNVPHGFTTGDNVTVILDPPDADFDLVNTGIAVLTPTIFRFPATPGTPGDLTATDGSAQKVGV